ncbi:putative PEP-binding protein [Nodularia sp. UHCC 0506]|uniref:putative PEP-binding protein n=1 Tax=Nodularia sp. UHCC 0506 TaxID=3110243 RepID=UPI002B21A455|nr:putative PEP-binding protein [Nodularia sp. UHCC 0506]MEA5515142.1 putative PEP-binding protein [Nodularia sp. UHCC 0506]
MDKLYWLDQIKLQDRSQVGDKAFYLSKIMQRGYPVVPGFVVSAEVLKQFLTTLNSTSALVADLPYSSLHLDVANWRQLQQVAGRLRQEIITGIVAPQWVNKIFAAAKEWQSSYLILRPSLALSAITPEGGNTSGLLDAIFCRCDEEAIASALKRTWSQLFRARSLLYWRRVGVNLQQINLAVLVQPAENAIASGLLYAHSSGWTIEATKGLGIALSQGDVQPDVYYIQQETGIILEQHLGNKMLAYGFAHGATVNSHNLVATVDNTDIVTYILEEAQQKQYALSEEYLQQVITLGNQLVSEIGDNFTIKWTLSDNTPDPTVHLTQVSSPHSATPNLQYGYATPAIIKGLGASGGRVTARATVITDVHKKPEQIHKGVILVVAALAPDWLPLLQEVAGIITETGGLTSHAAILARELGIPAVVSAAGATVSITNGERLLVDGDRGEVYRSRGEKALQLDSQELKSSEKTVPPYPHPLVNPHLPMISTQLLVNLSQPKLIEEGQNLPVDGVGLIRSELMLLNILEGQHPQSWLVSGRQAELLEKWTEQIILFARAFAPRPVFYRALDWRTSHELPSSFEHQNSVRRSSLGYRGTFSYVCNPAVFELELTALANVQKAGYSNINLLLPFVRSVPEFSFCRAKVEQAGLTQVPQFQLWIMAEVPSVLFLLPEYVKAGVSGISIGTNDLTQLLLGVDREQGEITSVLNERHPAVMGAIAQLIQMAKTAGIPCSICGQAPAIYPEIIDQLVEWGITSISVEPEAVERTYKAIARAEQRLILAAARKQIDIDLNQL